MYPLRCCMVSSLLKHLLALALSPRAQAAPVVTQRLQIHRRFGCGQRGMRGVRVLGLRPQTHDVDLCCKEGDWGHE